MFRILLFTFLLSSGLAPSCEDDVDLGDDHDAGSADAGSVDAGELADSGPDVPILDAGPVDSGPLACTSTSCGPMPPGLPCEADLTASVECQAVGDHCEWVDSCPADGEPCPVTSCEGEGPRCDTTLSDPPMCVVQERRCVWQLPAHCPVEGEECAEDACGAFPPGLPCGPEVHSTLSGRCIVTGGSCEWEELTCECPVDACGERGLAPSCGDTTMPAFPGPCAYNDGGICEWSWICE